MPIEEDVYENMELCGEYPTIPQWEAITDKVIAEDDTTEVSSVYRKPKFQEDLEEGFI